MNSPIPEITCPECHLRQPWRNQPKCIHCTKEMPAYTVAAQIYASQVKNPTPTKLPPAA